MRVKLSRGEQRQRETQLHASGILRVSGQVPTAPAPTSPDVPASPSARRAIAALGERLRERAPRSRWFWVGLLAILVGALALRLYGLNWDANNHLHPDERAIVFKAMCLTFPAQVALRPGNCDPAYTGSGWLLSPASPLNPHFFAYGSLPLYLLALVCRTLAWLTHLTGGRFLPTDGGTWDDFNHFTLVGRVLSALFDTGSVLVIGLLGRRLVGWRVGLLAAALVAVLPFEIQVAHFYAVDTVLTFFVLLTLLGCMRLIQGPSTPRPARPGTAAAGAGRGTSLAVAWGVWFEGLFTGAALGLALASKVSALPLILPVALALLLRWRRRGAEDALLAALGICAAAVLAFVLTSPYTLIDWHNFQLQVNEQTALSQGRLDYPYVRQFAGTTPYLYQIQQLLLYDMGLPLGLLGLAGAAWAAVRVWRRWESDWLIIVSWLLVYFAVIGSAYTKFSRYMLPLFPLLALCGAAALGALASYLPSAERAAAGAPWRELIAWPAALWRWFAARFGAHWWQVTVAALGITVLAATGFLGLALTNIYSAPNTRVQASEWIYDHIAPGAAVTMEVWDDSLPVLVPAAHPGPAFGLTAAGHRIDPGRYTSIALNLYDADTTQKVDQLAQQLASADVVVISSQRLLRSIPKLPDRYPMTTRYYALLFANQLGFALAAHFENPPNLAGFTLQDAGADESFSVYDHPPVWIFVRRGAPLSAATLRARLTDGIVLPAVSNRPGSQKLLQLPAASASADAQSAPLAQQFAPGSLANQFPLVWWLVIVELLGALSFPLAFLAFPGLRDRGWGLSKLVGLLVLAYLVWLPASLRLLPFGQATVFGAFALLAAAGTAITWWRREEIWSFVRARWRLLAVGEAVFLAAFGFMAWVRALDPDLWHIWRGGEKPMELAFLNGILRSQYFPPADPWFAGGHINYYYYGQYLTAVLIRLTGITPTTAFNLAIPLFFALTFTAAFSVVAGLTGRAWAGVAGGAAVVVVGNLDGAGQAIAQWRALAAHLPVPVFDFWRSSRVIPFTINEFPYWSFLYADLHAHVIDLPVVVLLVAICASLLAQARASWRDSLPTLALAALALGAAACINTWDFPTCALLLAVILIVRELGIGPENAGWHAVRARLSWQLVRRLGATIALTIGLAYALYLPFYVHFQSFVSGTGSVTQPTDPLQFFTLFGLWLFLMASFFIVELRDRWERALAAGGRATSEHASARLWGLTLLAILVLFVAFIAGVKPLLVVLLVAGIVLALDPRHSPLKLLTYALLLLGLVVALGVEVVYVRDFLDNSDWERMNTVFKFYYQVWTCFALGGALVVAQLAPRLLRLAAFARAPAASHYLGLATSVGRQPDTARDGTSEVPWAGQPLADHGVWSPRLQGAIMLRLAWLTALSLLLVGSLVFLVEGTSVRVQDPALWAQQQPPPGGVQPQGLSLDGMAYMRGWYPGDYEAITWMNAHIGGIPTIIEASNGPYRWYSRVSIYTGLPSVLGWSSHEAQQRYPDEVYARQADVQSFYTTESPQVAASILRQYGVQYVYVGQLERQCPTEANATCVPASSAAVQKYQTLVDQGVLKMIHQNADVTLFEVMH